MKRLISLLLAAVITAGICVPGFAKNPLPAAAQTAEDALPVIIVRGMEFDGLYVDYGTENERNCLGEINIGKILGAVIKALAIKTITGNREKAVSYIADAALEIFDGFSCNNDGSSKYNVGKERYPGAVSQYDYFDTVTDSELGITRTAKDTVGADKVYYFNYDWRMNPFDVADEINETVERALAEHNCEQVDLINCSMGGVMSMAYLSKYGYEKIHRLICISSTFCGTYATSDLFQGKVDIKSDYIYNYLLALNDGFAYKALINTLKYTGLISAVSKLAMKFVDNNKDYVFDNVLQPVFGNMLSLWALVLPDDYEACKAYMFERNGSTESHKELIAKADELQAMMAGRDAMLKEAAGNGMEICVVCSYNSPVAPAYERSYVNGDMALETPLMSGHGTIAPLGKTLENADKNSEYVSPDLVCDTSTCLFPDRTWLLKSAPHVSGSYGTDTAEFYMWLLTSSPVPDIHTSAQYPNFMLSGKDMSLKPSKKNKLYCKRALSRN